MNLHNFFKKIMLFFLSALLIFAACKKANEEPEPIPPSSDNISGKTVRYTVLVVPAGGTSFKTISGIDSAIVSLVMNDSIYNMKTDTNGLASFNNLAAGIAAVTVRYTNHTTANLIVDISAKSDTGYDSNNLRNAATMVALFPINGEGTATISGRTFADLDLLTAGLENAPSGIKVSCYLEPSQLINYVNHSGDGEILSISYEMTTANALTDANSDYTITVPAAGSGLKIVLTADDFQYNQNTAGGALRKVFKPITDTILVVSGINYFYDILYN